MKNYCQFIRSSGFVGGQVLGILLATAGWVSAAMVTVNPIADTMIVASAASDSATYTNNGGGALLGGSIYTLNRGEYSLLRFDFSSVIPEGSVISAVTLKMTAAFSYTYSNGETLGVWLMDSNNAGWVQGSSGDSRQGATGAYLNQTSYTSPSVNSGTAWAGGAIFNMSSENIGSQVGTQALSGVTAGTTYSFNLDPLAISSWLTDSAAANAGLVFHMTNNESPAPSSRFIYFHSMNASVASGLLPQLEITYAPVPEPTAVALLVLGGAVVFGMRARFRVA